MNIVVSGANGFVGSEIIRHYLRDSVGDVLALVREGHGETAGQRMDRVFRKWDRFAPVSCESLARIAVHRWDLTSHFSDCQSPVFFHAAASTSFDSSLTEARRNNVESTRQAIELAKSIGASRFVHVSTSFVAGRRGGLITESFGGQGPAVRFNNAYEQTKSESEELVRSSGLPWTILRPSIIVGDSVSGYTLHFRVIYTVLRLWASGRIPHAPVDFKARVDLVPMDYVAQAALALATDDAAIGQCVHLALGRRDVPAGELFASAIKHMDLPPPTFVPHWIARVLVHPSFKRFLPYSLSSTIEAARWHLPYIWRRGQTFDTSTAERLLDRHGIRCPSFEEFSIPVFRFCRETAWGKRAPLKGC